VKDDISTEALAAICRRSVIAQSRYAFGALLCVLNLLLVVMQQKQQILRARKALRMTPSAVMALYVSSENALAISGRERPESNNK